MGIPLTGDITMADIAAEFGGSTPHSLSEYYGAALGIPSSGAISMDTFRGKSSGTINYSGYAERDIKGGNNDGNYEADMPSNGASANVTIVAAWHDDPTYTTPLVAASGWTRLISTSRGRPYMGVFVGYGARTGRQLVCTGPGLGVGVNMSVVQFTSNKGNGPYYFGYLQDQWHSGNACWNGLGPDAATALGANEYYMLFFCGPRPTQKTVTVTTSGNTLTEMTSSNSNAKAFRSNKLYGYNGDPGDWNTCMNFGSFRGTYGWVMMGSW